MQLLMKLFDHLTDLCLLRGSEALGRAGAINQHYYGEGDGGEHARRSHDSESHTTLPDGREGQHRIRVQEQWCGVLLGICFLRGALELAVEGIRDGEKGGWGSLSRRPTLPLFAVRGASRRELGPASEGESLDLLRAT